MRSKATALGWLVALVAAIPGQQAVPVHSVRSAVGHRATDQALRDVAVDSLVLLVASHPDDRYFLPAVWLRRTFGLRVAVLLASRGGGAQNSLGSETGDALERIRTLETEAGASQLGVEVWYLDRPDLGFRRSAQETFAEWGREATLHDLASLLRRIRPDAVMTTHHDEEQHGHDLAVVELLPEAIRMASDPAHRDGNDVHTVGTLWLGARSMLTADTVRIDADRIDPGHGVTLRRLAYEILRSAHRSPGAPAPLDEVFARELRFEPSLPTRVAQSADRPLLLPSVLDPAIWPGAAERARQLDGYFRDELPQRVRRGEAILPDAATVLLELRHALAATQDLGTQSRLARRVAALEALLVSHEGVQFEVEVAPGTIAVAGEEFDVIAHMHHAASPRATFRVEGLDGVHATLTDEDAAGATDAERVGITIRMPRDAQAGVDPMAARFQTERFVPPVRLRFVLRLQEVEIPIVLTVPVEQRAPVELQVVPRMLLLPSARTSVQFSVGVVRNSHFPVQGELEVRGPAGYAIANDRHEVVLRDQRSDRIGFDVSPPKDRSVGADVLRIRLGENRVELPVHRVDVRVPTDLHVGLLRSRDDTLSEVLGVGGLGIRWSEIGDVDLAVADLRMFDTIVVDIRALRDRPALRAGFRRLLDFAKERGRRLVVFYQKNVEFHPAGESFFGAPFEPFQIGRSRVTRADAPVTVLAPDHPLMRHPNRIEAGDWDGWDQERALYLPSAYAADFEELLELHDPGQPAERGALLYARTGDGEYVYCALSLWRQLKKLHHGAVRLLANLLTPVGRE